MSLIKALNVSKKIASSIEFAGKSFTFSMSNNNANMAQVKLRIETLKKQAQRADFELEKEAYKYREDAEENRAMFIFEGKPEEQIRKILKNHSFKWSPTRGAWVRLLNNAARYNAKLVMEELDRNVGLR